MTRSAVLAGAQDFTIVEADPTPLGSTDARIAVELCGVCGSDVSSYFHGAYVNSGQVMGHEFVGTVVAVGDAARVRVGDRLVVRPMHSCGTCWYCRRGDIHLCGSTGVHSLSFGLPGGYAEVVHLPDCRPGSDAFLIPADLPARDALWCEPLAVALRAAALCPPLSGSRVAVVGAGSVGLCLVSAAFVSGAEVIVAEPRPLRQELARAAGAARVVADVRELTEVDVVLDSSGVPAAISGAAAALVTGGSLVLVGLTDQVLPILDGPRIRGSFGYRATDFERAVRLISTGRVSLGNAVTHEFDLDSLAQAMSTVRDDPTAGKVVIRP